MQVQNLKTVHVTHYKENRGLVQMSVGKVTYDIDLHGGRETSLLLFRESSFKPLISPTPSGMDVIML